MNDRKLSLYEVAFKRWMAEDTETDASDKTSEYAKAKEDTRQDQYQRGFRNFSVTVPDEAADYLIQALETFKAAHSDLWKRAPEAPSDASS